MSKELIEKREVFDDLLKQGVVEFTFEKKDGSIRDAMATLHDSHLPLKDQDEEAQAKAAAKRANNPGLVTFWDIEADGWRSFQLDTLLSGPTLVEEL